MKLKFIKFKSLAALLVGINGIINCAEQFSGLKLHEAATHGDYKKIKRLIDGRVDVNTLEPHGRTALDIAILANHSLAAETLIKSRANMSIAADEHGNSPLHLAAVGGNAAMVKLLLKNAPPQLFDRPDKHGNTPIMVALGTGNKDLVVGLLQKKIDPRKFNLQGEGPLHSAVICSFSTDALQSYLDITGALADDLNHLNAQGLTPLDRAILKNNYAVAKLYLEKGAIVNLRPKQTNSLHLAAATNFPDIHLMFSDSTINSQDENGCTPLHIAAQNGQLEVVAKLLQAGADCQFLNKEQESPLMAMIHQRLPVTRHIAGLLLEANANSSLVVNGQPDILETATFAASCQIGNLSLLKAFVSKRTISFLQRSRNQ